MAQKALLKPVVDRVKPLRVLRRRRGQLKLKREISSLSGPVWLDTTNILYRTVEGIAEAVQGHRDHDEKLWKQVWESLDRPEF